MSKKQIVRFITEYKAGKRPYLSLDELLDMLDYLVMYYESREPEKWAIEEESYKLITEYALSLYPDNSELVIRQCRLALLFDDFDFVRVVLEKHEGDAEFKILKAEYLLFTDQMESLESYMQLLIDEGMVDSESLHERIILLSLNRDYVRFAYRWLEKAVKLFPKNEILKEEYAYLLQETGMPAKAMDEFNALVELNPFNPDYWMAKGKLHAISGEYDQAIDAFDFALSCEVNPDLQSELLTLKMLCLYLNQNYLKTIEVAKELNESSSNLGSFVDSFLTSCYIEIEDYESAYQVLSKINWLDMDRDEALNHCLNFIFICMETYRDEEAKEKIELLEEILQMPEETFSSQKSWSERFFSYENDSLRYLFVMNRLISFDNSQHTFTKIVHNLELLYPDNEELSKKISVLDDVSALFTQLSEESLAQDILLDEPDSSPFDLEDDSYLYEDIEREMVQTTLSDKLFAEKSNWN